MDETGQNIKCVHSQWFGHHKYSVVTAANNQECRRFTLIKALKRNTIKPLPTYTEAVLGSNLAVVMKNKILGFVAQVVIQGTPKYLRKFMTFFQTFQLHSCLTEIGAFLQIESVPLYDSSVNRIVNLCLLFTFLVRSMYSGGGGGYPQTAITSSDDISIHNCFVRCSYLQLFGTIYQSTFSTT